FTRLTNAFSKSVEFHMHAVSLHYMYVNFVRPHSSLGKCVTPAMAAGVADYAWSLEDVARMVK
ncbi:MAG: IS1 family transposase, partial [bacterium]|nr:IS1 family transposase [bacterium]